MAPSTVFSYLRRDHRRSSAAVQQQSSQSSSNITGGSGSLAEAATSSSSLGNNNTTSTLLDNGPPQLPGLPPTTDLTETFREVGVGGGDLSESSVQEKQEQHQQQAAPAPATAAIAPKGNDDGQSPRNDGLSSGSKPYSTAHTNPSQTSVATEGQSPKMLNGPWGRLGGRGKNNNDSGSPVSGGGTGVDAPAPGKKKKLRINTSFNHDGSISVGGNFVGGASLKKESTKFEIPPSSADHGSNKPSKTKRHLLNPISLLGRRRSSQVLGGQDDMPKLVPALPDDYDPRIRGNIVHDFSAPRPRRTFQGRDGRLDAAGQPALGVESTEKREGEQGAVQDHGPVLQGEDKGSAQQSTALGSAIDSNHGPEPTNQGPAGAAEVQPSTSPPRQAGPPRQSSKSSMDSNLQRSNGPTRLKSDASRFSFDMAGVGSSTQEKLLEEKHKQKEAARRAMARSQRRSSYYDDFDDEDFDYDAIMDDGGLEERIPGVNADADDDDEFSGFAGIVPQPPPQVPAPLFVPNLPAIAASPISPSGSNLTVPESMQDAEAALTEAANSLLVRQSSSNYGDNPAPAAPVPSMPHPQETVAIPARDAKLAEKTASRSADDDDLYYDDGEFGELPAGDGKAIDESLFDDETSHLYARQFYPGTRIPIPTTQPMQGTTDPVQQSSDADAEQNAALGRAPSLSSDYHLPLNGAMRPKYPSDEPPRPPSGILSEHNLEAFQNALARVADEAGKDDDEEEEDETGQRSGSPSETANGKKNAQHAYEQEPAVPPDLEDSLDDFQNYDDSDAFLDDQIIAEANAEALENDDEGFYGQEFGFYAHHTGPGEAQPYYGGYFGPAGVEGINRRHSSGRGKFREPSLTPITERSEWSTRNSIISLAAHGAGAAGTASSPSTNPALAQLVDMGGIDEEFSLDTLRKLRRGAFGGSNGSLRSSVGSLSPAPQTTAQLPLPGATTSSHRASFLSIPENSTVDDIDGSLSADPRVSSSSPLSPLPPRGGSAPSSPTMGLPPQPPPVVAGARRRSLGDPADFGRRNGHSRNHSSPNLGQTVGYEL
ncbi:hypothetical protein VTN49DRAFT_7420 [Thermomyces lanuginosus]|uniref:uncharacterized protein n=1 Tax=Thermomyces lanuginosus TaxID=5541 RepID=UPI003742BDCD